MIWAAVGIGLFAAGGYVLGLRRGAAGVDSAERRRLLRSGWKAAAGIVVFVIAFAFLPEGAQPWVVVGLLLAMVAYLVHGALRGKIRGPALEYLILVLVALGVMGIGVFLSGWAGTATFVGGILILIVGGRVLKARQHQSSA